MLNYKEKPSKLRSNLKSQFQAWTRRKYWNCRNFTQIWIKWM